MLLYISLLAALCTLYTSQGTCLSHGLGCVGHLPRSCEQARINAPYLLSGEYRIANSSGDPQQVFCEMDTICGGCGWIRVAKLDMTEPGSECPGTLRLYEEANGVKACGRKEASEGTCDSVIFPSHGIHYSQICGRVIGYQYADPSAFHWPPSFINDIDVPYVDGVSITYGFPRQHIWTLAATLYDSYKDIDKLCPCSVDSAQRTPSFVQNDYYCESGCSQVVADSGCRDDVLYTEDRLWDGENCGQVEETCCSNVQPWFHKVLACEIIDDIELRICCNGSTDKEDIAVEIYEIYVK